MTRSIDEYLGLGATCEPTSKQHMALSGPMEMFTNPPPFDAFLAAVDELSRRAVGGKGSAGTSRPDPDYWMLAVPNNDYCNAEAMLSATGILVNGGVILNVKITNGYETNYYCKTTTVGDVRPKDPNADCYMVMSDPAGNWKTYEKRPSGPPGAEAFPQCRPTGNIYFSNNGLPYKNQFDGPRFKDWTFAPWRLAVANAAAAFYQHDTLNDMVPTLLGETAASRALQLQPWIDRANAWYVGVMKLGAASNLDSIPWNQVPWGAINSSPSFVGTWAWLGTTGSTSFDWSKIRDFLQGAKLVNATPNSSFPDVNWMAGPDQEGYGGIVPYYDGRSLTNSGSDEPNYVTDAAATAWVDSYVVKSIPWGKIRWSEIPWAQIPWSKIDWQSIHNADELIAELGKYTFAPGANCQLDEVGSAFFDDNGNCVQPNGSPGDPCTVFVLGQGEKPGTYGNYIWMVNGQPEYQCNATEEAGGAFATTTTTTPGFTYTPPTQDVATFTDESNKPVFSIATQDGKFATTSITTSHTTACKSGEVVVNGKCQPKAKGGGGGGGGGGDKTTTAGGEADKGMSTGVKVAVGVAVVTGIWAAFRLATNKPIIPGT